MRAILILLLAAAAALFEPNCFRFAARHAIRLAAWRNGVSAQIAAVDGSLFEPLIIRDSVWTSEGETGQITRIEIRRATAEFSWRNLFSQTTARWFQRLTLEGIAGKMELPADEGAQPSQARFGFAIGRTGSRRLPAPERIEARDVDFVFQSRDDYVRLEKVEFALSSLEAGTVSFAQIVMRQPWLTHSFRDVRGVAKIDGAKIDLANLTLEPGVQIREFSADLDELAGGRLNLKTRLAAFGGEIVVEAQTLARERPLAIEATVDFSKIAIAKLATFLGVSEAAGGTIRGGNLKFRGSPKRLQTATGSLRIDALNFQWESRQWDSLVLGAALMEGRVQIPQLALAQGHNRLNLTGEMALPTVNLEWWRSEFTLDVTAKIDDLTELSALLLPEFKFAAGKANIDGSIRGKNQRFNGQLILSGSDLRWRNAPIEELHAAVKITGNELQVTNFSFFNEGDYVRGRGVVNILGEKQYWGELHASIDELATYAAILQKPIVPEPLAGGAVIEWSGEGSAKGHSGKFLARLKKVRTRGATAALMHPINADLEGSYAAGGMLFSRFALADDESSFTANVAVGNNALSLQGIRLMHGQTLWLEGDALLPLDVWNAWPNTSLATLLDEKTAGLVNLKAFDLQLRDATRLSGWEFPIEGIVRGNVNAGGPLAAIAANGKLTLRNARIPLGRNGAALENVDGEATFSGQKMLVQKLTGRHAAGDFRASGEIDFANLRDPILKFAVASEKSAVRIFRDASQHAPNAGAWAASAIASLDLQVAGRAQSATVSGTAKLLSVEADNADGGSRFFSLSHLLLGKEAPVLPPVISPAPGTWAGWQLDIACGHGGSAVPAFQSASPVDLIVALRCHDLKLRGSPAEPALIGSLGFITGFNDLVGASEPMLREASVTFRPGFPHDPSIALKFGGRIYGEPFAAEVAGTLRHPIRFFSFAPPLTEKAIRAEVSGEATARFYAGDNRFSLRVPPELTEGVEFREWLPIPEPARSAAASPGIPPAPAQRTTP